MSRARRVISVVLAAKLLANGLPGSEKEARADAITPKKKG